MSVKDIEKATEKDKITVPKDKKIKTTSTTNTILAVPEDFEEENLSSTKNLSNELEENTKNSKKSQTTTSSKIDANENQLQKNKEPSTASTKLDAHQYKPLGSKTSTKKFKPLNQEKTSLKPKHSPIKIILLIFLILILLSLIAFSIYTMMNTTSNKITLGISIKGIDVSGLTTDEAKNKINTYIAENLPENIQLKHNDYETSIPLSSLEVSFDIDSAVTQANSIGKSGNLLENEINILKAFFFNEDIEPYSSINEEQLIKSLNDISSKLPDTVIESSYYIDGNNLIVTSGKSGNVVDVNQMKTYIKNGIINLTLKNRALDISTKTKEPSAINIEKIYEEIHKEPVNASYTQNPYTIYPSENGLDFAISLDEAKALIESENKEEYSIPLKVLYPSVTTNMIGTEAFPDLLSEFKTTYSTRDTDRTTNLQLAANKINGTVLMPGETFSYNQVVGERTIAAGYREAPIYVQGQVVDGLGGGICQITSTLYNAVIYANLEIVERSNHQFVPSYVSASRDATVVYGSIDFKFKNNRNYPIKLVCSVSGGIAQFQIFGLRTANDYEVVISSYETGRTSTSIYSEAYKILKQNGQVVSRELLSRDTYKRH